MKMKKPLTIALALSLAVSAIGLSAAPASAHDRHWRSNDGAALAIFGAVAGLAAVAAASQHRHHYDYGYYGDYPPPRGYYRHYSGYSPHVAWCVSHYRTYNPATNTYFRARGVAAVCYSPY
jgi:hypothetical protein